MMLRGYYWLCIQVLLLVVLRGSNGTLEINPSRLHRRQMSYPLNYHPIFQKDLFKCPLGMAILLRWQRLNPGLSTSNPGVLII